MKKLLKQIMVVVMLLPLPVLTSVSAKADEVLEQNEVVVNQESESSSETTTSEESETNEEDSLVTDEDKQLPLVEENEEVQSQEEVNNFEVVYQDYQQTSRDTYTQNTDEMSNAHSEGKNNAGNQELRINTNGRSATLNEEGIEIINGKIVKSEPTVFSTLGGSNTLVPFYKSVEDCIDRENQIPISGAAYDGLYLETIVKDGSYIAKVVIGGLEGYVDVNNIQIIPSELVKARSYYVNENGTWNLYEANDPLTSSEYSVFNLGTAPSWAVANQKYVAGVDDTYQNLSTGEVRSNFDYFQHLPMRATTEYTAQQFQSFLRAKGKTNSQYYNGTVGFIDGGNKKGVNPLLLFAMANHESAYGTSTFARRCNNFFGRGAFDADPDKACQIVGFNTAYDGAAAQAYFLSGEWADALDYRYYGSHPGNKISGMNVYYASDPNWGLKVANHMRDVDNYLGGKENNKFSIGLVQPTQIYVENSLQSNRPITDMYGNTKPYRQQAINGGAIPTIITGKSSSSYQIQLDTPANNGKTQTMAYYAAKRGSFPNYEGPSNTRVTVPTGACSFVVEYGDHKKQQGYITLGSVTILNHSNYVMPGSKKASLNDLNGVIAYESRDSNGAWLGAVDNGVISGEENYNSPLTGFRLKSHVGNSIKYRVHLSNEGWQDQKSNSQVAGSDRGNAIEAIQIDLEDNISDKYELFYKVYVKDEGWLGWAWNGQIAGSIGYSKPIYAIKVQLCKKGTSPGRAGDSYISNDFLYQTHYAGVGWSAPLSVDGNQIPSPKGLRLEAIRIFKPSTVSGDILSQAHIEGKGWVNNVGNGEIIGTVGKSLRLEAMRMKLTGQLDKTFNLYYKTNVEDAGWGAYNSDFNTAGSTGVSKAILGTAISVQGTNSSVSGVYNAPAFGEMLSVNSHQQNIGWKKSTDLQQAGETGRSLQLEAIELKTKINGLGISYQSHVQNIGWQNPVNNGQMSGTTGRCLRIEGIKINLTGSQARYYDVVYRTHIQGIGWQNWVSNGQMSGTQGKSLRVESIEIKIVPKTSQVVTTKREEE